MEKVGRYFLFGVFALIFVASFVSAAGPGDDIRSFINGFAENVINPVASIIFGETFSTSFNTNEILLSKVLFFAIISCVVWLGLNQIDLFKNNKVLLIILSLAVSILATRWLGDASVVQAILLPYSALGVTISAAFPFLIWFAVVNLGMKNTVPVVRRIAWVFFGVVFLFLWAARYSELGSFRWIYPLTALAALLMAFADGTMRRFFVGVEVQRVGKANADDSIIELKRKIGELPGLVAATIITPEEAAKREKKLKAKIAFLSKY